MGTMRFGLLNRFIAALVLISILAFGQVGRASAGSIRYVKAGATGLHNGTSWTNAFTSLQQALNVAVSGDQIWVAKGTYKPSIPRGGTAGSRNWTFTLRNGVAIYGGFAGTETLLSQRNPAVNVTILSGDIGVAGNAIDNAYHVVFALNLSAGAILDGFTITGGNANASYPNYWGGGLYNITGNPTLRNLVFSKNRCSLYGAGLFNDHGSPLLAKVMFSSNISGTSGGGMYTLGGDAVLTNVAFDGNIAGTTTGHNGGALYEDNSSPTLTNVTFSNNKAGDNGGAVYQGNNSGGSITNATFGGNSALSSGGAIYIDTSLMELVNVTFNNNSGGEGGGAIYNGTAGGAQIFNTIFGPVGDIAGSNGISISDSVLPGGVCPSGFTCTNLIAGDPKLDALQNNGGFSKTMALGAGSSAIDTANGPNCPAQDERGVVRPQGTGCDIGAYEVKALPFRSQGVNDGWVLETSKGSNTGGTYNSTGTSLLVGDDASNRRYRSIVSFTTSPLPDTATVVLARIRLLRQTIIGNPTATQGNLVADLANPYFGGNVVLQAVDWQAPASFTSSALNPSFKPPFAAIGGGWYAGTLNPAWLGQINKVSTTQFRLRLPSENNNGAADYFSFYSGNTTTVANQPVLWVYYNP